MTERLSASSFVSSRALPKQSDSCSCQVFIGKLQMIAELSKISSAQEVRQSERSWSPQRSLLNVHLFRGSMKGH